MFKILVTDYQWPSLDIERAVFADLPGELIVADTGEERELIGLAPQADAILTCWKPVTPKVIDAARRCRIITRYGVGLDNIAVEHATRLGIPVTNAPTYCLDEVAEHAIGLLFALQRRIVRFDRAIRGGDYGGVAFAGMHRIQGRALGLLGYGNIGRAVAKRARGVGLRLLTHDPAVGGMDPEIGRAVTFEQLLAESDTISLHVPLTPQTRGIINAAVIARMKPGAFLINTARGGLVDLDAVLHGLERGPLEGAALDVYPDEPPDLAHPLFRHERFIATPHAAFYSEESVENLQRTSSGQVRTLLSGGTPENIVNPAYREHPSRTG
jgi:phosphoglycerate dehydrogenase-like enzyme